MSGTRKIRITRRAVLRGAGGVAVGLPLLEAWHAQAAPPPPFAVFVVGCNGVIQNLGSEPERFWPEKTGALSEAALSAQQATRATALLAKHASMLTIVRGVDMSFRMTAGCAHTWGDNQALTASKPTGDLDGPASGLAQGESLDQRIGREGGGTTGALTLHAGGNGSGGRGYGNPGYVSYLGPKMPAPIESSPFAAYQRLVGMTASDPALAKRIAARRLAVNDLLRDQIKALAARQELSMDDRRRLDDHFTAVREVEIAVTNRLPAETVAAMKGLESTDGSRGGYHLDANREQVIRLHMDLVALALASGAVRAVTLKIGDNNDGCRYVVDGVQQVNFHWISHRNLSDGGGAPPIDNAIELHARIDRMMMGHYRYLLDKLAATSTPTGNLLDAGFAVWTNQVANGNHDGRSLPYVIAGKAGGALRPGRFLDLGGVPHVRLLRALLWAAGVRGPQGGAPDDFGDASLAKGMVNDLVAS